MHHWFRLFAWWLDLSGTIRSTKYWHSSSCSRCRCVELIENRSLLAHVLLLQERVPSTMCCRPQCTVVVDSPTPPRALSLSCCASGSSVQRRGQDISICHHNFVFLVSHAFSDNPGMLERVAGPFSGVYFVFFFDTERSGVLPAIQVR